MGFDAGPQLQTSQNGITPQVVFVNASTNTSNEVSKRVVVGNYQWVLVSESDFVQFEYKIP